jgi:hypothetical protein
MSKELCEGASIFLLIRLARHNISYEVIRLSLIFGGTDGTIITRRR